MTHDVWCQWTWYPKKVPEKNWSISWTESFICARLAGKRGKSSHLIQLAESSPGSLLLTLRWRQLRAPLQDLRRHQEANRFHRGICVLNLFSLFGLFRPRIIHFNDFWFFGCIIFVGMFFNPQLVQLQVTPWAGKTLHQVTPWTPQLWLLAFAWRLGRQVMVFTTAWWLSRWFRSAYPRKPPWKTCLKK